MPFFIIELETEGGLSYFGDGPESRTDDSENATIFRTYEEAEHVVRSFQAGTEARIIDRILGNWEGFRIAVTLPTKAVRYIAKDKKGWHTTRVENAHLFDDRESAEEIAKFYRTGHKDVLAVTVEWTGSEKLPDWLRAGARVAIPGGPTWTIEKQFREEVHLTPPEGGPAAPWPLKSFLMLWDLVRPDRFDRDDPI